MTAPPMLLLTSAAFALHIGGGAVGLVSGTVAAVARKGGQLHRTAGGIFFYAMIVMSAFACYLAVVMPGQIVNLFIGVYALYLITTAWMTVRRPEKTIGLAEWIALLVATILLAPFALLDFELLTGAPPFFNSAVALKGPVLVAILGFSSVLAIAAIADAKVVFTGGVAGAPRIARHLWRMCLGLMLAAGSAFTNGFARLLPGPYHVPTVFFLPQFLPVALLVFWMIRVRFTGWYAKGGDFRRAKPGQ